MLLRSKLAVTLVLALFCVQVCAQAPAPSSGAPASASTPSTDSAILSRGQQISAALASVTSTAISPLLGVCLLGIYHYTRTPEAERAALPFYDKPFFWIPISGLLLLIFMKDTIGGAVPLLKKPLDAIEVLIVNKASLVLIAFPVMIHQVARLTGFRSVPEMAAQFWSVIEPSAYAASFPASASSAGHVAMAALMLVAGAMITFVVWIVGHAADVIMLLSPFPFLDLFVKGLRAAVLVMVAGSSLISTRLGVFVSLAVIAVCLMLFAWALRIAILGTFFAWDLIGLLMFGHHVTPVDGESIRGFTVGKVRGMPRHTFGRLTRDPNGILEFRYRRWGFDPSRLIRLDDAVAYQVGRGLLYPSIVLPYRTGTNYTLQFRLLPRYNGSEEQVRAVLGLACVRDLLLSRGFRKFKTWLEGNTSESHAAAHGT